MEFGKDIFGFIEDDESENCEGYNGYLTTEEEGEEE